MLFQHCSKAGFCLDHLTCRLVISSTSFIWVAHRGCALPFQKKRTMYPCVFVCVCMCACLILESSLYGVLLHPIVFNGELSNANVRSMHNSLMADMGAHLWNDSRPLLILLIPASSPQITALFHSS